MGMNEMPPDGLLENVKLFSGLPFQELEAIARRGEMRVLRGNTVFMEKGDAASTLYLLISGRVRIYLPDAQGGEKELSIQGPGEHIGEMALLGDPRRTASAVTLEESRFLVLSRRAFLECLAENPQISVNLNESLVLRNLQADLGMDAARGYQAWCAFRQSGMPLVLLIGGCSGSGKSTVAAELSLRLDIGRTQSTDVLREIMRLLVSAQAAPALHGSSFDIWRSTSAGAGADGTAEKQLLDGYKAQADALSVTLDGVLDRCVTERASTIIEGVHVQPDYHQHLDGLGAVVVPLLLRIPEREDLARHFLRRGRQAPERDAERYLQNLDAIWQLQGYLVEQAWRCGVQVISNLRLDNTVKEIMALVTRILVERFMPDGDGVSLPVQ